MSDIEQSPPQTSTEPKRWVLQELGGGASPRLGELEDLPGGGVRIRFQSGDTVEWDSLPRSTRPVVEGSLTWRAALEREALVKQLAESPGEVLALILQESGARLVAGELQAKLAAFRIIGPASATAGNKPVAWEDVWRRGRPALVRNPHVDVARSTYMWTDTAIEPAAATK